eukprot:TRINITY_DN2342_c0_g2_i1.p1 TRINITY_DN2342_c0_g2~~TRINITY_DN2342_c0_g2_i1.p1  ORF type:complete len:544 (+),score=110.28 TRINITY_DN2342_c0_g2_i1:117-1634(+)
MNDASLELAKSIINEGYARNAQNALQRVESAVTTLLAQRRLPDEGWSDELIEMVLHHLSLMDSNNYIGNVGVGEREGRVYSQLVKRRHYGMSHGIGRSGDLTANQPKAAGSSLIYALANLLAADAIRIAGAKRTESAVIVPMATGMALTLVLQSLPAVVAKPADPSQPLTRKRWVVWSRIDQKTCLKCIYTAGFEAWVVPLVRDGDYFVTDVAGIEKAVETLGKDNVLCVLTTTSCFAPRLPDKVLDVSRICAKHDVPHVVNNAYGVQSQRIMKQLNAAMEHGRVDAFVQSGDKNFMVPVGGSVVASPSSEFLKKMAAIYAGRASCSTVLDIFITLLSLGRKGFASLNEDRVSALPVFQRAMGVFAEKVGERVLVHPDNDISFCLTTTKRSDGSALGSSLFNHCVSGPRVVKVGDQKTICGNSFNNYGSHSDETDYSYLTVACALGIRTEDIDVFMKRLETEWTKLDKKAAKDARRKATKAAAGSEALPAAPSAGKASPQVPPPA